MTDVTVRRATAADQAGLARLAELDSRRPPRGPVLVAEIDSRMLAALPLESGSAIADPFKPTAELVALLELRRSQMASARNGAPRRSSRMRALLRGRLDHAQA